MKKIILLLFIFVQFSFQAQNCEDYPKPINGKRVYDYYNQIDDDVEKSLEDLLHRYEDSIGVQMAVLTLSDLGEKDAETYARELGNCWGVGERNVDNGIVFLVSFVDRKWQISTGRTTEIYLTDYDCNRIGESFLIPNLRDGHPSYAIQQTVGAIIEKLGWKSFEEREREAVARKERTNQILKDIGFWIIVLLLGGLFVFLVIKILKNINKRKELVKIISGLEIRHKIPNPTIDNWPKYILKEFENIKSRLKYNLEKYDRLKKEFIKELSNPWKAEKEYLNDIKSCSSSIYEDIRRIDGIPNRIKEDKENSLKCLSTLNVAIKSASESIKRRNKSGFFTDSQDVILKDANSRYIKLDLLKVKKDKYPLVIEESQSEIKNLEKISESFLFIDKVINSIKNDNISLRADDLSNKISVYYEKVESLKGKYPNNIIPHFESNNISNDLKSAKEYYQDAKEASSMKKQEFSSAKNSYDKALRLVHCVQNAFLDIDSFISRQESSEKGFSLKKKTVESEIEKAEKKCKSSDVSEGKKILKKAKEEYEDAIKKSKKELVNWILVISILDSAEEFAKKAYKKAEDEINDAERRRRRNSSTVYGSTLTGSGLGGMSSGGSGGSFGGFGGGSFGGGGAGGSW